MDPHSQVMPLFSSTFLLLLGTLPFFAPDAQAIRHKPLCHSHSQRVACAPALLFWARLQNGPLQSVCLPIQVRVISSQTTGLKKIIIKKRLASHARRVRKTLLRHALRALPISLLIFRKKTDCFAVYFGRTKRAAR